MLDLKVFSQESEYIIPGIGTRSVALQGMGKLIQIIVKCLLTTPGKDVFDPDWGVGLRRILPVVTSRDTEKEPMPEVSVAIAKAQRDIIQSQVSSYLKPEEMLDSLTVRDLRYNFEQLRWELDLNVKSKAGTINVISLGT